MLVTLAILPLGKLSVSAWSIVTHGQCVPARHLKVISDLELVYFHPFTYDSKVRSGWSAVESAKSATNP